MKLQGADGSHFKQIRALFSKGRHRFLSHPEANIETLLQDEVAVVGLSETCVCAFLSIAVEERPCTLADNAPTRGYVTSVAFARGYSPYAEMSNLLEHNLRLAYKSRKLTTPCALIICYGSQQWLVKPLLHAGFAICDRVTFFLLDQLNKRDLDPTSVGPQSRLQVRSENGIQYEVGSPNNFGDLAQLDSQAFSIVWHMSASQLRELSLTHQLIVATDMAAATVKHNSSHSVPPIGYAAITIQGKSGPRNAQLARLAVHPDYQGRGIGNELLRRSLRVAQQAGALTVSLNTQEDNISSNHLYRRMGFVEAENKLPVLSRIYDLTA